MNCEFVYAIYWWANLKARKDIEVKKKRKEMQLLGVMFEL